MKLTKAFQDLAETLKKAPKRCPSDQLAFWITFGARFVVLAEALAEHNEIADRAADEITRLRAQIAEMQPRTLDADSLHPLVSWTENRRVRMTETAENINKWMRSK